MIETMFGNVFPPVPKQVEITDYHFIAEDGHKVLCRWYRKKGTPVNSPAIVYYHGGSFIASNVAMYDGCMGLYANESGIPFLAVESRRAPEYRYPTNVKDGYAGLMWLFEHAAELGVDPTRIAVMGDSSGGTMAAAIIHWNLEQDHKLSIVKQFLIYPTLDDRNTNEDMQIGPFATWTHLDNATAWECLLGDLFQAIRWRLQLLLDG